MNLDLTKAIDEAYNLYMPQVRYEIEEFYEFLADHYQNRTDDSYNVLEIGTKFGGTFYLWCMMNLSSGLNISIDLPDGIHGGINKDDICKRNKLFLNRFNNCYFIEGDSHNQTTKLKFMKYFDSTITKPFNEVLDSCIDFLFIDGDHTLSGVTQDWIMYSPFLKINSICAFHDIKETQKHRDRDVYVSNLWNEITENRNEKNVCIYNEQKYQIVEFIDPLIDWGGIGCLIRL